MQFFTNIAARVYYNKNSDIIHTTEDMLKVIQPTVNYIVLKDFSMSFTFLKYSRSGKLSVVSISHESII